MRVFLTGGAGFIGSHLAERMIAEGHSVVILDDLSTGSATNLQHLKDSLNFQFINGSILDADLVYDLMKSSDSCVHLGAALGVQRILANPYESFVVNTRGTENVLVAAANLKKRIFLASTSEIYGKNPQQPLHENSDRVIGSPLLLRWVYSEAKAMDESLAQMFHQSHGLDFVTGRFFNTVGPRQSGMYGMVLPRFVSAAIAGEPLQIYGDGSQTRTFCHVQDAVDAVVKLFFAESIGSEVFNIGGDGEISIYELANMVISTTNSKSDISFVPYSKAYPSGFEETTRRVPDTTKLRSQVNWFPKRNLKDIIQDIERHLRA